MGDGPDEGDEEPDMVKVGQLVGRPDYGVAFCVSPWPDGGEPRRGSEGVQFLSGEVQLLSASHPIPAISTQSSAAASQPELMRSC